MKSFILILVTSFLALPALGSLKVVATVPEIAWVAKQIGGELVQANSLLEGSEDPHHVDVVPSFIFEVAQADLVCALGMELEDAWLDRVITRSGNQKVKKGTDGYCELGRLVSPLGVPKGAVDRSQGHVHSAGNPHFNLGPKAFLQASREVLNHLIGLRPEQASLFQENYQKMEKRFQVMTENLQREFTDRLKTARFFEYHQDFAYFAQDYGLVFDGSLEEVPGAPPSAGRLAERAVRAKEQGIKLLVASEHAPERVLRRFSDLSGVPYVQVPTMLTRGEDYLQWQKSLVEKIVKVLEEQP